jgi:ribosomal protein S18 acetylase RimI-like enzyme
MTVVTLRVARPTDVEAIAAIHQAARRDAMPYLPELHGDDEVRAWVAEVVLPNATVWIAEIGGQVVGYASLRGNDLDQLYVAPGHQGRGVGSRLLQRAKELSPTGLRLYAFQRNTRARAFYEARGFIARRLSDGSGNEENEPDVLYAWMGEV